MSANPAGRFNARVPGGLVYVEPFSRRVRGIVGGKTVVDSERVLLVHRAGEAPGYAFPESDVHVESTAPEPEAPGYVRVRWDSVEEWYEEDERVHGHPRNPYHRVDCVRTSRRLRAEVAGTALVDSAETVGVYETALSPRLYVTKQDARMDLLEPSTTTIYCPYKGTASYWNVVVRTMRVEDVAWSYEDPLPECVAIGGLLCFDETRATVTCELPPDG